MLFESRLETPRLFIRPFEENDVPDMVSLLADQHVHQYVGDGVPLSESVAHEWVKASNENLQRYGFGTGAVIERETNNLIGWAGFARPEGQPEEIIYGLGRPYWKQGYGRELLHILVIYGARVANLPVIRATVHSNNSASISLLENYGFMLAERNYLGEADSNLYHYYPKNDGPHRKTGGQKLV